MAKLTLKAEVRKIQGRKVKKLRREGILPANVYGKKVKSKAVKVALVDFQKTFSQAGETSLVDLVLGKVKLPVLIHNVQVDPVTDNPIHVDFLQVNLKEKVTAQIPIELFGESPAEKQGLGTVIQHMGEVEIEALPTNLPDKFEIDLSKLENVDDSIKIGDIKVDKKKVEIKDEGDRIIVKVEPLRKEEEEAPPETEAVEGEEATAEGAVEEGKEGPSSAKPARPAGGAMEGKAGEKKEGAEKPKEEKNGGKETKKAKK